MNENISTMVDVRKDGGMSLIFGAPQPVLQAFRKIEEKVLGNELDKEKAKDKDE